MYRVASFFWLKQLFFKDGQEKLGIVLGKISSYKMSYFLGHPVFRRSYQWVLVGESGGTTAMGEFQPRRYLLLTLCLSSWVKVGF